MPERAAALEIDQYIAAPRETVWRAITDPDRLARWWFPGDIAAEVGHEFHLDLPGRGRVPCRVLVVDEPGLLVHSVDDGTLTWRLVPEGRGTRLVLEHGGPAAGWELAQVNVALPTVPLSEPELQWFVDALEPVNAAAEAAPGFRWRLQTDDGDATGIRVLDDDRLIVNLTVWTSLEALADFVYRDPAHVAVLRRRRESFARLGAAHQVLWWVPAGHRPTVAEAEERLARLRAYGPTPVAFTFRQPFGPPGSAAEVTADADWYCRA